MTAFLTRTEARPTLWIFGAGHIGTALAAQARLADVGVRVVDDRAEWARPERFDADVQLVDGDPEDLLDRDGEGPSRGDWALVTTHAHPLDEALVRRLATRDLGYLGLIGSRAKWARFRARLLDRGVPAEALERVRCPAGLDLGASTPAEIAVSIVAELVTVRRRGAS
jgi:xanthine dehydrogenase accessory factor